MRSSADDTTNYATDYTDIVTLTTTLADTLLGAYST